MRFRFHGALVLGAALVGTWAAACSSFGSASDDTAPDAAGPPDGAPPDAGPPDDAAAEAAPESVCSKPAYTDTFTMPPTSVGWEPVGGGTFTLVPDAGNPPRQALVTSVDLSSTTGQEAHVQRYVPVSAPTSVRLRYGYYATGNTGGGGSVGCRLTFEGSTASELRLYHHYQSSSILLEGAPNSIATFDYASGTNVTDGVWHDVDLRVDIAGSTGNVTLVGFDTTTLGALPIPAGLTSLRLRCGSGLLDYSSGKLDVGISRLELDVCP